MATATTPAPLDDVADLLARLGDVAPSRVLLTPPPGQATEADLAPARQRGRLCELIDGVLVEKAMGRIESFLASYLITLLNNFVLPRDLGRVSGPDGPIGLGLGLVRVPDAAFFARDRPGDSIPDLAIEVLSPSNTAREIDRKVGEFLQAGIHLVWVVDPRVRTVRVHASPTDSITLGSTETLDGGDVLPGFALPLVELFSILDRKGG